MRHATFDIVCGMVWRKRAHSIDADPSTDWCQNHEIWEIWGTASETLGTSLLFEVEDIIISVYLNDHY